MLALCMVYLTLCRVAVNDLSTFIHITVVIACCFIKFV